jgi:hypothetical protein
MAADIICRCKHCQISFFEPMPTAGTPDSTAQAIDFKRLSRRSTTPPMPAERPLGGELAEF